MKLYIIIYYTWCAYTQIFKYLMSPALDSEVLHNMQSVHLYTLHWNIVKKLEPSVESNTKIKKKFLILNSQILSSPEDFR